MQKLQKPFLIVFLALLPSLAISQHHLTGRLVGFNGLPLQRADIFLLSNAERYPRAILKMYTVDSTGAFFITFEKHGLYRLQFAGVGHKPLELPFYISPQDTTVIQVRLSAIRYKTQIDEVVFVTDYDADSLRFRNRTKVSADSSGIFAAKFLATDSLFEYEIGGIDSDGHTVNGTQADFFAPDRSGDYFSVIETHIGDTVSLQFDPKQLLRSQAEAGYEVMRAADETRKFLQIHTNHEMRFQK